MADSPYAALASALDRLPNGHPHTDSGVGILILERIFSPEEAVLAALLGREPAAPQAIAARGGLEASEVRRRLTDMARRGLVWPAKGDRGLAFRLAPFIAGTYESQTDTMDHELAHLVEDYRGQGGIRGIMGPLPSVNRVVLVRGSVKSEWILPHDDAKAMMEQAKAFSVSDCICRKEQQVLGLRACSAPIRSCLGISPAPRAKGPTDISREEALALLDQADEAGLVHTVRNLLAGVSSICNCCGCCCAILRGINEFGLEHSVAAGGYRAFVDAEACTGCGVCVDRCQVKAIAMRDGIAAVDERRCIGCGLCASGCAAGAASLARGPEGEIVRPPADYAAWERARLAGRGLPG